jgi:hypothetical protein
VCSSASVFFRVPRIGSLSNRLDLAIYRTANRRFRELSAQVGRAFPNKKPCSHDLSAIVTFPLARITVSRINHRLPREFGRNLLKPLAILQRRFLFGLNFSDGLVHAWLYSLNLLRVLPRPRPAPAPPSRRHPAAIPPPSLRRPSAEPRLHKRATRKRKEDRSCVRVRALDYDYDATRDFHVPRLNGFCWK